MRILVLNPPFYPRYSRSQRSPAVIKSGVLYYPIWLAYATGVLEQDGFAVKLLDAPACGASLADVVVISVPIDRAVEVIREHMLGENERLTLNVELH